MDKLCIADVSDTFEERNAPLNWFLCILCQNITSENLSNPANNPRSPHEGYVSLALLLEELDKINQLSCLPFKVNLSNLNDGLGLFETMKGNNAKYHKSCKKECSNSRLARAQKRAHSTIPQNASSSVDKYSPVKTRRQSETFQKKVFCFVIVPELPLIFFAM